MARTKETIQNDIKLLDAKNKAGDFADIDDYLKQRDALTNEMMEGQDASSKAQLDEMYKARINEAADKFNAKALEYAKKIVGEKGLAAEIEGTHTTIIQRATTLFEKQNLTPDQRMAIANNPDKMEEYLQQIHKDDFGGKEAAVAKKGDKTVEDRKVDKKSTEDDAQDPGEGEKSGGENNATIDDEATKLVESLMLGEGGPGGEATKNHNWQALVALGKDKELNSGLPDAPTVGGSLGGGLGGDALPDRDAAETE